MGFWGFEVLGGYGTPCHGNEHTEPGECKFLLAAQLMSRCGLCVLGF